MSPDEKELMRHLTRVDYAAKVNKDIDPMPLGSSIFVASLITTVTTVIGALLLTIVSHIVNGEGPLPAAFWPVVGTFAATLFTSFMFTFCFFPAVVTYRARKPSNLTETQINAGRTLASFTDAERARVLPIFKDFIAVHKDDNEVIYLRRCETWVQACRAVNERRALDDQLDALNSMNTGQRELELMLADNNDVRKLIEEQKKLA